MSAVSKRTRADQKELAERVAAVMRDAHVQLRLWGRCKNENCQRERNCCGDAEQCGARVAPASWAWLRDVVQRMLQGTSRDAAVEAANFARLGIRARRTVSWHVKCWDPIEFVQLNDGTWTQAFRVPQPPPLEPLFSALVRSPWLQDAVRAAQRGEMKALRSSA
jgi:hypothetical protein